MNPNQGWFQYIWLWVAIEPMKKHIIKMNSPLKNNTSRCERFMVSLINTYCKHPASIDGG